MGTRRAQARLRRRDARAPMAQTYPRKPFIGEGRACRRALSRLFAQKRLTAPPPLRYPINPVGEWRSLAAHLHGV